MKLNFPYVFKAVTLLLASTQAFAIDHTAPIDNFDQVSPWVYRGAQPEKASDYDYLVHKGIKTLINLRELNYNLDSDANGWKAANQRAGKKDYSYKVHSLSALLEPSKDDILWILKDLTTQELLPAYVHCQKGRDRTGMVIGLYEIHVLGWTYEQAHQSMVDHQASAKWLPMWWALRDYSDWDVLTSNGFPWDELGRGEAPQPSFFK